MSDTQQTIEVKTSYADGTYRAYVPGKSKTTTVTCTAGEEHAARNLALKHYGENALTYRINAQPSHYHFLPLAPLTEKERHQYLGRGITHLIKLPLDSKA